MTHAFSRGLSLFLVLAMGFMQGCSSPKVTAPQPTPTPHVAPQAPKTEEASKGEHTKVGLLLPLSGPHASLGKALLQSAQLSLLTGEGDTLELLIEDTKGTKEGARLAARKVVAGGARLILGPVFADAVTGAAEAARPANVPLIAFSNNRTVAKPGVYIIGFDPTQQLERVLRFAAKKGLARVATYVPKDANADLAEKVVSSLAREGVITSTGVVTYAPQNPGLVTRKPGAGTQAVLIPEGGTNLVRVVEALLYHDTGFDRYKLLGSGQWDAAITRARHEIRGGWFAAPVPSARTEFETRFTGAFGYAPPRLATLSYDAVSLARTLVSKFASTPFSAQNLERPQGFLGIDGPVRLRASGISERALAVLEVTPTGFDVIDPAPRLFEKE